MAVASAEGQVWNFPAIHAAASSVEGQAAQISGLHTEGKGTLARLSAHWGGAGSTAYIAVQNKWDTHAEETNNALISLARSLHNAAQEMQRTESGVQARFS